MSTYKSAAEAEFFNSVIDELTKKAFYEDIGKSYNPQIDEDDLKKTAWASSVLAESDKDKYRKKALSTAVLLFITHKGRKEEPLYRRFLYTILSRLGNLPSTDALIEENDETKFSVSDEDGSLLDAELDLTEQHYRLDKETVLTKFQKDIWQRLDDKYVVFSGPTSSGKSFIIRRHIKDKAKQEDGFQGIYLVPSRALISEVSAKFRSEIGEVVDVRTSAHLDGVDEDFLLVLTPERCLQLFDYENDETIDIDLIFLDEIQQFEDEGRGPLFENVLENLETIWDNAQIIAAGPFIDNPSEALESVVQGNATNIKTIFNPVFQLEARFTFEKRTDEINVELMSPSGEILDLSVERPTGLSYSTVKTNKKETIKQFVDNFGQDYQSLVYSKTQRAAENMAKGLAESRQTEVGEEMQGLIDFLKRSIHKDYALVDTLRRGVAFHHGSVPQVARDEIEALYRDEIINAIACTPTLLQGVNLPAEKMYVVDPGKGQNTTLSDFEFQNLIGRVGRVGTKLYGTIYYIDREDDEWSEGKLNNNTQKEITSATTIAISENQQKLLEKVTIPDINEIEDQGLRYTIILLRNRYLKDSDSVEPYLKQKGADEATVREVIQMLHGLLEGVEIPQDILRKNPTVDPILQNQLYINVVSNSEIWEINPNELHEDFFNVTERLNAIFEFAADTDSNIESNPADETRAQSFDQIRYTAYHWLSGKNYRELIERRKKSLEQDNINTVIKQLMKIINTDVQYVLVKYYKILCDILESIEDYDNQFMMNFDKRLERGSISSENLDLMDMGIDRSIALDLDTTKLDEDEELEDHLSKNIESYSSIYQRHLHQNGIVPEDSLD